MLMVMGMRTMGLMLTGTATSMRPMLLTSMTTPTFSRSLRGVTGMASHPMPAAALLRLLQLVSPALP
ncbi:MAG TPA: hypothetical protein VGO53_09150, partial [Steroidobacteraceae bacterium]|nr:hypothetical protein [Steroidobacteraceae bacterium]